jgi:hypothetical protein
MQQAVGVDGESDAWAATVRASGEEFATDARLQVRAKIGGNERTTIS